MRLYSDLFLSDDCAFDGCRIKAKGLWGTADGGLIRACTPAHAQAAEKQQRQRTAANRPAGGRQ